MAHNGHYLEEGMAERSAVTLLNCNGCISAINESLKKFCGRAYFGQCLKTITVQQNFGFEKGWSPKKNSPIAQALFSQRCQNNDTTFQTLYRYFE